ncbi:MAG: PRC and DUF2382 domain-containing protein [Actinomycetota bacterium]|nr:PRC and DUF2382 domain-containing protein [Actinomycetota bacterium]
MSLDQLRDARGTPVYAADGDKIGAVEELFYDEATGRPEWIGIGTGFFGTKRVLVPTAGAEMRGDGVFVPYEKDQVKGSPDIDSDEISEQTERDLATYYGLGYSEQRSETGLPEGRPDRQQRTGTDEESVVRHEEEMQVGTRGVEAGRARLRKWVETEPVQMDVELQRETARVTREEIDRPVGDAAFQDEEVEVPLRAEEAVVQKQAVAKERVGLEKDVETERETVRGDVRKERIDVEGDDERLDR